jgi:hypothetical protein
MSQEVMNTLIDMSQEIIKLKDQKWELLGALKRISERCHADNPDYTIASVGDTARAAIAKAEGEKA